MPAPSRVLAARAVAAVITTLLAYPALAQDAVPLPEAPAPKPAWYEAIEFGAFVDGTFSFNANLPKPQVDANRHRLNDRHGGFALGWAGVNVAMDPAPVGGRLELRYGPTSTAYHRCDGSNCDGDEFALTLVKEAVASWRVADALQLDFGKMDAFVGLDDGDSQETPFVSRSLTYTLLQPRFFTGLQAEFGLADWLRGKVLVANGYNRTLDNNLGKTLGAQLVARPVPEFQIALGWVGGPEQDDSVTVICPPDTDFNPATVACAPLPGSPERTVVVDRGAANEPAAWRHLGDASLIWQPRGDLVLALGAMVVAEEARVEQPDLTIVKERRTTFASQLLGQYRFDEHWSLALRGEYLHDPFGAVSGPVRTDLTNDPADPDRDIASATVTLELAPVDQLLVRLEQRGDFVVSADGDGAIYPSADRSRSDTQLTTTLGVVLMLN